MSVSTPMTYGQIYFLKLHGCVDTHQVFDVGFKAIDTIKAKAEIIAFSLIL